MAHAPGVPAVDLAPALREALAAATYTFDAVGDLLGTTGQLALARNETTPALRRTTGGSPLETLVRLFLLQTEVDRAEADRALPGLVDPLAAGGLLVGSGGEVRALLDCRPYADDDHDWWVVSDLTPGLDGQQIRVAADHVLGVSPASTSLAQLTLRAPVGRALDLGTGCGVQALHLSGHAVEVVATDVNARALAVTAFNAALNDVVVDVRDGSLWEPVADERFDLVTTNPPFVISPATAERLVYRDSGLPGDQVVEAIVRGAPAHLVEGGWCQVLANWAIATDRPWDDRLAGWIDPDCDALVVQREVLDPASYVELWLRDAGRHGSARLPRGVRRVAGLVRTTGHRGGRVRLDQPAPGRYGPRAARLAARGRAADRARDRRLGPGRPPRGRARRPAERPGRRTAGDGRCARSRGPGDDRAAPADRPAAGPPGRHGRGSAGRSLRR